jgi:hypothetical protein
MLQTHFGSAKRPLPLEQWFLHTYIIEGNERIITRKSLQRIFGQVGKSNWLFEFLDSFERYSIVPASLLEDTRTPIHFKIEKPNGTFSIEEGYLIGTLLKLCNFIIDANNLGYLSIIEVKLAKTAKRILSLNEAYSISARIDENSGFNFFKEKTRHGIKHYMLKHNEDKALHWLIGLPDPLWTEIFTLFGFNWQNLEENAKSLAEFLHKNIFGRISPDIAIELQQNAPKRSYRRKNGKAQKTGVPKFDNYLSFLEIMIRSSNYNIAILEQLLERSFPLSKDHTPINFMEIREETPTLSDFDKNVKRGFSLK